MTLDEVKNLEPEQLTLDFNNNNIKTINAKQLDSSSRYVQITCTRKGKKVVLDATSGALIACKKPDGYYVLNDCEILEDGTVLVELTQQMLAVDGKCVADLLIFSGKFGDEVDIAGLLLTDDGDGNVTITGTNDVIQIISDNGLSLLTTMSFYINVLRSVVAGSKIESSYEYDALIDGLLQLQDAKANEFMRQENETERMEAEIARKESEALREMEVDTAVATCNTAVNNCNTAVQNCNNAIHNAETATDNANTATNNANEATTNANNSANNANSAADNASSAAEACRQLLNENILTGSSIIHNFESEDTTKVPDASLVKQLYDMIQGLPSIHHGTELDNSIGKDGDIYMVIIDENSEGGE